MKNKKKNFFWIFQENMEKCGQKSKMMKKGHILLKKAKIDDKLEKDNFFDFFLGSMEECQQKVEKDENGSDIDEKGQN